MSDKKKESIQDRIKLLKNARAKSVLENRKVVYDEAAGIKKVLIEKRKLQDLKDEEEIEEKEKEKEKGVKSINVSSFEYTAEEDEKWEKKQGRIKSHTQLNDSNKGELHNYRQLAERTYAKNIRDIEKKGRKKTNEEYEKDKEEYNKLKSEGLSSEQIRSKMTSKKTLDNYVKDVISWEKDVFNKRRKLTDEGKDGAIHEKNRQFNSKLDRHYRQFKK